MRASTKKNISLSIINTQTQLINVVEMVNVLNSTDNYLIVASIQPDRIGQIKVLLKQKNIRLHFKKIHYTHIILSRSRFAVYWNHLFRFLVVTIIALMKNKSAFVITGNYLEPTHRYLQLICSRFNHRASFYVVDDGTNTLECCAYRQKEMRGNITSMRFNSMLDETLYKKLLSRKYVFPRSLTFFTIYDIGYKAPDSILRNSYSYSKRNFTPDLKIKSNVIVIIGQCLVEENILKSEDYQDYINSIIDIESDTPIYYYTHPGEKSEYSNLKKEIIRIPHTFPIEMILINVQFDILVYGFYSSALYTLKKIDPSLEINAIVIESNRINDKLLVQRIKNIYSLFEQNGIRLINKKRLGQF